MGLLSTKCSQCGSEIKFGKLNRKDICYICIDKNNSEMKSALGKIIKLKIIEDDSLMVLNKCNRNTLIENFKYIYDAFISDAD